jgi:hypothetical protein
MTDESDNNKDQPTMKVAADGTISISADTIEVVSTIAESASASLLTSVDTTTSFDHLVSAMPIAKFNSVSVTTVSAPVVEEASKTQEEQVTEKPVEAPVEAPVAQEVVTIDLSHVTSASDDLSDILNDKITKDPRFAGVHFDARIVSSDDDETASAALVFSNPEQAAMAAECLLTSDLDVNNVGSAVIAKTKKKKNKSDEDDTAEDVAEQLSVLHDGAAVRSLQKLYTTYVGDSDFRHFTTFVTEVDKLIAKHRGHVGKDPARAVAKDRDAAVDDVEGDDEEDAGSSSSDAIA